MITQARTREDIKPAELDWITALRAPAYPARWSTGGALQLPLFDQRDMAKITFARPPRRTADRLPQPRTRHRAARSGKRCSPQPTRPRPHRGQASSAGAQATQGKNKIGLKAGAVSVAARWPSTSADHHRYGLHLREEPTPSPRGRPRRHLCPPDQPARRNPHHSGTVPPYKCLSQVERAFRTLKTVDLNIRPVFH